jgi:hypothetical protein
VSWTPPDVPTPAVARIELGSVTPAPLPAYLPTAAAPRRRTGLIVVVLVLAALFMIGVGSTGGWLLATRSASATEADGRSVTPPPDTATSPPALPPDEDPSTPQYAMLQLVRQLGQPDGFDPSAPYWVGSDLQAHYLGDCVEATCQPDTVRTVRAWAQGNGLPATAFPDGCLPAGCTATVQRAGFTVKVALTAQPEPDAVGGPITMTVLTVTVIGP